MPRSLDKLDRLMKRLDQLFPQPIEWQPQPGPQSLAYHSPADELLFGGNPGGGKSDLICGLAVTAHQKSLILRREATRLNEIRSRLESLNYQASPDRLIELGGVKEEKSKFKYKGRAHDLKAFDELSEFTRSQYEYIKTWNRTADPAQRCRVVSTANPPETTEGLWINEYWAPWLDDRHSKPAVSGELRYFIGDEEVLDPTPQEINGKLITPRSRTFIASTIYDNPVLLATGYDQLLHNLTGGLTRLIGSFSDAIVDHPYQVIPAAWVDLAFGRWRSRYGDCKDGVMPSCNEPQDAIAMDVARGGEDDTVVGTRHGEFVFVWSYPGTETKDGPIAASKLLLHRRGNPQTLVDVVSWGSSAYDHLKTQVEVIPFNGANKSFRRDRSGQFGFANLRAAAYWNLRELLDPAYNATLALPPIPRLKRELTAARWFLSLRGIQLEEKEAIKQRLGHSPDYADTVSMLTTPVMVYESAFG